MILSMCSIGYEPDDGDQHVQRNREPRIDERKGDAGKIEERRYLALEVATEGFGQHRLLPVPVDNGRLQQRIGDGRHQQRRAVNRSRQRSREILPHPGRGNLKTVRGELKPPRPYKRRPCQEQPVMDYTFTASEENDAGGLGPTAFSIRPASGT